MASLKVICVNVRFDCSSGFPDVPPFCQIGFFVFERAEPSLDHDVVCPAAFPIHALPDAVLFNELLVVAAGELTSLITIILNSV